MSNKPAITWTAQGDKYTSEEIERKHELGDKETIALAQEEVRQVLEKERMDKVMNEVQDKMQMEVEPVPNHWIAKIKFDQEMINAAEGWEGFKSTKEGPGTWWFQKP